MQFPWAGWSPAEWSQAGTLGLDGLGWGTAIHAEEEEEDKLFRGGDRGKNAQRKTGVGPTNPDVLGIKAGAVAYGVANEVVGW